MPRKGEHHTPEARARISAARTGQPSYLRTPESRQRLSDAMIGNRNQLLATIKGECVYCGDPATTYDHPIPRGRPDYDPSDTVLACITCNDSKRDRTPDEWLAAGLYGPEAGLRGRPRGSISADERVRRSERMSRLHAEGRIPMRRSPSGRLLPICNYPLHNGAVIRYS